MKRSQDCDESQHQILSASLSLLGNFEVDEQIISLTHTQLVNNPLCQHSLPIISLMVVVFFALLIHLPYASKMYKISMSVMNVKTSLVHRHSHNFNLIGLIDGWIDVSLCLCV